MPISIPPIEGQIDSPSIQFAAERRNKLSDLPVNRTDPLKVIVMLGHFE
jgi:hypothetical protein